jgi:Rne/Rng family ribonuclease
MVRVRQSFIPGAARCIELYPGPRPIFDLHGIEEEISLALQQKVVLKSGGHLLIDQTEAMTTIDVNTGAYVGHRNLEETIYRTNLEAAVAIARQLRCVISAASSSSISSTCRTSRIDARCSRRSSARSRAIVRRPRS